MTDLSPEGWFERLHSAARELLAAGRDTGVSEAARLDFEQLVEEFDTYFLELHLQNQELRHVERQLKNALLKSELLFEALPFAAVAVDGMGVVRYANGTAALLFGFRVKTQLLDHSVLRLLARDDHGKFMIGLSRARGGEIVLLDEIHVPLASGLENQVEVQIARLPPEFHSDDNLLVTFHERTASYSERRQAGLLDSILNTIGAAVSAFGRDGRCLYANRQAAAQAGLLPHELIGLRRDAWMTGSNAIVEEKKDAQVLGEGAEQMAEDQVTCDDGSVMRVLRVKAPLLDEQANCYGVGEIAVDVTRLRQIDRRLDLAGVAYNMSHEAIMVTDGDNRIISVNRSFEQITGYLESEVHLKDPKVLGSERHDRLFLKRMWTRLSEKGHWEGEIWNRRKNGETYPAWMSINRVEVVPYQCHYVAVFADITQRKAAEEEIEHLAFYDILTGVANRYLLADRVTQAIHAASRESRECALVFFDLDRFKQINDRHGHQVGDHLLKQVAQRVSGSIRDKDTLSRLGGDEFVLLLTDISSADAHQRLGRLLDEVNGSYRVDGLDLHVSASFGVAMYPADGSDFHTLLKHADTAMYLAKEAGRASVHFFNNEMTAGTQRRMSIESALHRAVPDKELSLVFQPQVCAVTQSVVGFEALLRWESRELGELPPLEFISIAERSGLIVPIGKWALHQAFAAAAELQRRPNAPWLSVNVSARQLREDDFIEMLEMALADTGASAELIELEITESTLMHEVEASSSLLPQIKKLGFRISIDDFGTGYSSLAYLSWMKLDQLKIDRAFVRDVGDASSTAKVCRAIIGLAHELGLTLVAEGIETAEQLAFLRNAGCEYVQGFYVAEPMSLDRMLEAARASAAEDCPTH